MPAPESKRRWFHLSPDRFVVGWLLVICLLWLSERFQWFGFNHHKGWTVLIAVAAVGVALIVMLLWWATSLVCRWRFQFSIRSLLAFCLACSIAVSWFAVERQQARRQKEVVELIGTLGGGVLYDPEPQGPEWLRKLLGIDFFSAVNLVGIGLTDKADAILEQLKGLPQLERLQLVSTEVTDAGLEHLKGLTKLKSLNLQNTHVTDAGLFYLKDLIQLQSLNLTYTQVTDAGVDHLKGLTQLQSLDLSETKEVTDAGLKHLKGLTGLRHLDLTSEPVTDAGLEHLKGLRQLQSLNLMYTQVTDAGIVGLRKALPNCNIRH